MIAAATLPQVSRRVVCVNAFDENDEYTDVPSKVAGWSVYVREEYVDASAPHGTLYEEEFPTEVSAMAAAVTQAEKWICAIRKF